MPEELIIRHCSPTLAGMKTGSLFMCPFHSRRELLADIRRMNYRLTSKGLRMLPMRFTERGALLYLYRPSRLEKDLADGLAAEILRKRGYESGGSSRCLARLMERLRSEADFPHEIGLFLGYPPEDVHGFMEKGARCCKCAGCWKVYGDPDIAQKLFAKYKKCTRVYHAQWTKGKPIERLAVAG